MRSDPNRLLHFASALYTSQVSRRHPQRSLRRPAALSQIVLGLAWSAQRHRLQRQTLLDAARQHQMVVRVDQACLCLHIAVCEPAEWLPQIEWWVTSSAVEWASYLSSAVWFRSSLFAHLKWPDWSGCFVHTVGRSRAYCYERHSSPLLNLSYVWLVSSQPRGLRCMHSLYHWSTRNRMIAGHIPDTKYWERSQNSAPMFLAADPFAECNWCSSHFLSLSTPPHGEPVFWRPSICEILYSIVGIFRYVHKDYLPLVELSTII